MRVYTDEQLEVKSKEELKKMKDLVMTNSDLTDEEKDANIDKIDLFLNSGVRFPTERVMVDIKAGMADIDDIN